MFDDNWQVKIMEDPRSIDRLVLIYRVSDGVRGHDVLYFADGTQQVVHVAPGALIDEKLYLRMPVQVLQAFQIALAGNGIQTEQESTIRGKYEAQGEHLADLQHMIGWFMNGKRLPKPFVVPSGMTIADHGLGYARGPVKSEAKKG